MDPHPKEGAERYKTIQADINKEMPSKDTAKLELTEDEKRQSKRPAANDLINAQNNPPW